MVALSPSPERIDPLVNCRSPGGWHKDYARAQAPLPRVDLAAEFPFYARMIKHNVGRLAVTDPDVNLGWRAEINRLATKSPATAAQYRKLCSIDMLFWINLTCWGFDPRPSDPALKAVPFITWDFQNILLYELKKAIGHHDMAEDKSRDMGGSWAPLLAMLWFWRFHENMSFMLVSRKEAYVDERANPDSLFWKLDYTLERQPRWLTDPVNCARKEMSLVYLPTKSTFQGESTTGNVGVGGRRSAVLLDEFALFDPPDTGYSAWRVTQQNTPCRIAVSTYRGSANCFYDVINRAGVRTVSLHWTRHPAKRRGLYWFEPDRSSRGGMGGTLRIIDKEWHDNYSVLHEEPYPFVLDGKIRSPWYDAECARAVHPVDISQELDMDPVGSDFPFYDIDVLDRIADEDACEPMLIGELLYDPDTADPRGFVERAGGPLWLWFTPDVRGNPPSGREYSLGVDVSQGRPPGESDEYEPSSNNAISVADKMIAEKVAEYVEPNLRPEQLAMVGVALGRWFRGTDPRGEAYMVVEAPGPGRSFLGRAVDLKYRNFYYRTDERKLNKQETSAPGFFPAGDHKTAMHSAYRRALAERDYVQKSDRANDECRAYVYGKSGKIEHRKARSSVDPSGTGESHGDIVVADALSFKGVKERPQPIKPATETAPPDSFAGRRSNRRTLAKAGSAY